MIRESKDTTYTECAIAVCFVFTILSLSLTLFISLPFVSPLQATLKNERKSILYSLRSFPLLCFVFDLPAFPAVVQVLLASSGDIARERRGNG
jgi:hypothetical protein